MEIDPLPRYKSWRVICWQLLVWSLTKCLQGNKTNLKNPQKFFCQRYKIYGLNEGGEQWQKNIQPNFNCLEGFGSIFWGALVRGKMKGPPFMGIHRLLLRLNMHSSLCSTWHYLGVQFWGAHEHIWNSKLSHQYAACRPGTHKLNTLVLNSVNWQKCRDLLEILRNCIL